MKQAKAPLLRLTRRELMSALAALGVALALPGCSGSPNERPKLPPSRAFYKKGSEAFFSSEVLESGAARRIGDAYIAGFDGDLAALTEELEASRPLIERGPSGGEIAEALEAQIARDFRDGRTATVRGWVLSKTEAHLCAMAAIEAPAA